MDILVQSLIYLISFVGIIFIFFILTDEEYDDIIMNNKKNKIIDIYVQNMNNEEVKKLTLEIENMKNLCDLVDIVNIHQKFDKY